MVQKSAVSTHFFKMLFAAILAAFILMPQCIYGQQIQAKSIKQTPDSLIPFGFSSRDWKQFQNAWKWRNYEAKITTRNGQILDGQVLFIKDEQLLFWNDPHSFFNPLATDSILININASDITKIIITDNHFNKTGFIKGVVTGGLLGSAGGVGLYILGMGYLPFYVAIPPAVAGGTTGAVIGERFGRNKKEIVPFDLEQDGIAMKDEGLSKDYQLFTDTLPPSIFKYDSEGKIIVSDLLANSMDEIISYSPQIHKWSEINRFNIFAQMGKFDIPSITSAYPENVHTGGIISESLRTGLGYRISLRFLAEYSYTSQAEFMVFPIKESDYFSSTEDDIIRSHSFYISWLPLTANGFLTKKIDLCAGVGLSLNPVLTFSNYQFILSGAGYTYYGGYFKYSEKETIPGLMLKSELDYYILKWISFNAMIEKSFLPAFRIPEHTQNHPETGDLLGIEAHKVNFSGYGVRFGLKFHL